MDTLSSEEFGERCISEILLTEQYIRKIWRIYRVCRDVLSHQECDHDILTFIDRARHLMAKNPNNLSSSHLCECYICFIILFILYTDIDISIDDISDFLSFMESPECCDGFFDFLCFFEVKIMGPLSHSRLEIREYRTRLSREECSNTSNIVVMLSDLARL